MDFEVSSKDLLGRIGRIETKSGVIETPHLFPVVNSLAQPISPREILDEFKCNAIMTNAYLAKKNFGTDAIEKGIHGLLNYDKVIATDSGAYQILRYGDVQTNPSEIAEFQEKIGSDIAVILDVPTGWQVDRPYAEWTVRETLSRADQTLKMITREDVLWEGPIQGGTYIDLVAEAARKMSEKPFAILSLGSPTPVMERYLFDILVDMIMAVKSNIPFSKPLHLFGAGHPIMFSLAAALGCDLFDSASYALFARQDRYMTTTGTHRLSEIQYFPCSCPACQETDPKELAVLDKRSRERTLARHNLYVCLQEIRRIKQAIIDGRLWELVEIQARAHPSLMKALTRLSAYSGFIEKQSPSTKRKGLLFLGDASIFRPELQRHSTRILKNHITKSNRLLLLVPQPSHRPFHDAPEIRRFLRQLPALAYDVVFYGPPYGFIPIEIDDVYPLSQTEAFVGDQSQTANHSLEIALRFVEKTRYKKILLYAAEDSHAKALAHKLKEICESSGKKLVVVSSHDAPWHEESVERLVSRIKTLSTRQSRSSTNPNAKKANRH